MSLKFSGSHRQTGFLDLLCDAIFQLRLAGEAADAYAVNRHSRASLLASVLCIECCANCLIDSLSVSAVLNGDIEKLSALSKLELYLQFAGPTKLLDRGDHRVSKVAELIKIRNEFVHPKITNIPVEVGELTHGEEAVEWPMEMSASLWNSTKIPRHALFWNAEHAKAALSAIADFFSYLFDDLLGAGLNMVKDTLFQRTDVLIGDQAVRIQSCFDEFSAELVWAVSYGFKLGFLGFGKGAKNTSLF